jgi:hypothetical protein
VTIPKPRILHLCTVHCSVRYISVREISKIGNVLEIGNTTVYVPEIGNVPVFGNAYHFRIREHKLASTIGVLKSTIGKCFILPVDGSGSL